MSKAFGILALLIVAHASAAEQSNHWAYAPLTAPAVPTLKSTNWVRNSIDNFVAAKLESKALVPAPEADKRTLLRRVYFNLIGLPPSPEESKDFLADTATNAYGRVVDRLLASPRYGERWARHWMDASHFAETHGHDQDRIRTNAWPYRDYLVASFNQDKPYARFVQEQVAGDAMFPDDPQATVALGFLAAGPWDESSLRDIREDTIDRQIARYLDRDDMVSTVINTFTSTTIQCARCHNHKFDPIPQSDHYALQAVFSGVDRANRTYDADPAVQQKRAALLRKRKRVDSDRAWLLSAEAQREVSDLERAWGQERIQWKTVEPQTFLSTGGATFTRQTNNSILVSGTRPDRDTYTVTVPASLSTLTAIRLEVFADDTLPKRGPGRQDNGNFHLNEFQALVFEQGAVTGREIALASASADFNQTGWMIEHALDRQEKTGWAIFPKVGESHYAVFRLKQPVALKEGATLMFVLKQLHGDGHLIGKFRLAVTDAQSPAIVMAPPADVERVLSLSRAKRSDDEQTTLASFALKASVARELAELPKPSLVYAAASDFEADGSHKPAGAPRPVHVLKRGDINKPLDAATPGALSCVSGVAARFQLPNEQNEAARRTALAAWLTHPTNALTWRSIVNRVWHHHFGRGLVETPNDFGKMGSEPSHPELLDWLAVWFRDDARGSMKALHRLIVTSATYRQSSVGARSTASHSDQKEADAVERVPTVVDGNNRFLSHMNRTRLDADQIRDAVLQISGCLDLKMGGPSDMQFDLQPGHHVTPKVDYSKFSVDSSVARRRSVYRFLFRTLPDPFMDALDCPAGDQLTPVRNASVTVQQALAMWNNAFIANYAERLAHRLEAHSKQSEEQVSFACELVFGRPPNSMELNDLSDYARKHGLANLCRVLFNSNEFMFVN